MIGGCLSANLSCLRISVADSYGIMCRCAPALRSHGVHSRFLLSGQDNRLGKMSDAKPPRSLSFDLLESLGGVIGSLCWPKCFCRKKELASLFAGNTACTISYTKEVLALGGYLLAQLQARHVTLLAGAELYCLPNFDIQTLLSNVFRCW